MSILFEKSESNKVKIIKYKNMPWRTLGPYDLGAIIKGERTIRIFLRIKKKHQHFFFVQTKCIS